MHTDRDQQVKEFKFNPVASASPWSAARRAAVRLAGALAIAHRAGPRPLRSLGAAFLLALPGLAVLTVAPTQAQDGVEAPRGLAPSGLSVGDKFRLLFVTSTVRRATSSDIADYNTHVQNAAGAGHQAIRDYDDGFRVVGCTATADATTNTATRASDTDAPIYWLNGGKIADDYADFYDGSWENKASPRTESGSSSVRYLAPFSGCTNAGTKSATPLRLDGSAIRAVADDEDAKLDFATSLTGPNRRVVALPLEVESVEMASRPASGDTYGAGETITARLHFGEAVRVTGTPYVYLEVGGRPRRADHSGGTVGSLDFSYTVMASDFDSDGVRICNVDVAGVDCGRIHLHGGTIRADFGGLDIKTAAIRAKARSRGTRWTGCQPP